MCCCQLLSMCKNKWNPTFTADSVSLRVDTFSDRFQLKKDVIFACLRSGECWENDIICTRCGLNVSNSVPTTCLNDLILQYNLTNPLKKSLESFTVEEIVAKIVTRLEELVQQFQTYGYEKIVELYCKRWMHGGADVSLQDGRTVRILGIDENGFLTVLDNGEIVSLQSADWNSFDLMRNLITCKQ